VNESTASDPAPSRLARADSRPILVSVVAGGWLLLCFFGAARVAIVVVGFAANAWLAAPDPIAELARRDPELVGEATLQRLEQERQLVHLDLAMSGPLLFAAATGALGAIRLLQRRRWSRALLLAAGLLSMAITGFHMVRAALITIAPAIDLPEAPEINATFFAVAGINTLLQSIPVIVAMSLLRHPIVRSYVKREPA
jgi:hypothetical protein